MNRIKLLDKQWTVFNPVSDVDYDITLYQGGVGSGKTFLGSLKGLRVLAQNHGATWLVGADSWERLKMTTWESWQELLHDAKVKHNVNKSDHTIRIPGWGNARALFKGIDDPMALRSVNGIGGHLEEASLLLESSYLEFLGRLRQAKDGQPIEVVLTTNPQAQKGWLFGQFVKTAGVHTQTVRGNDVTISRRRVIAATLDNPYVSDAFIAALRDSYDDQLYEIMVLGHDGDYTRGLVSHNFSELNVTDTDYKPDLTIYLTCDFNLDPNCWKLAHQYNDEFHFFDEIVIENTNNDECVDEFVNRYPDHRAGIILTGDASGGSGSVQNPVVGGTCYTQMRNRFAKNNHPSKVQINVRSKNPPVADRIAAWNAAVCNTDGVRKVFINPRCKWLIHDLQNYKYKEGLGVPDKPSATEMKKDSKRKFLSHPFDAASYLVERYAPVVLSVKQVKDSVVVPQALNKALSRGRRR